MQLAIVTPLATQRDCVSMLAPLEHAPETTSSSAAPTSTHSDEGEWTSRTSARTDRRLFTSLRGRPPLPYRAQISPFGAALSATRYRRSRAAPAAVAPGAVMGTRPSR